MDVVVQGRCMALDASVHLYCERRIRFAIGRFRDRVSRVLVHVGRGSTDAGAELVCQMVATVDLALDVVAVHRGAADAFGAVDGATRELAMTLDRTLRARRGPASTPPTPCA